MSDQNRILIIADIESFIIQLMPLARKVGMDYRVLTEELDYFFDWAINQTLSEYFGMKIIHHYRHDIYLCMYSVMRYEIVSSFKRTVNIHDLRLLKGCEVKTLVNGRDLFITRRNKYFNYF